MVLQPASQWPVRGGLSVQPTTADHELFLIYEQTVVYTS